MRNFLLLEI